VAALRGWNPFVALQAEYSLLERTAERELLPVAEAFGLSVCAWAPMGAGILTGKYTADTSTSPIDPGASGRTRTCNLLFRRWLSLDAVPERELPGRQRP
jgi:aryl-alcohol dehydrogenase-like predicted oxidoreductase